MILPYKSKLINCCWQSAFIKCPSIHLSIHLSSQYWPLDGAPPSLSAHACAVAPFPVPITIIENEQQPPKIVTSSGLYFQQIEPTMTELRHRGATDKELQHQNSEDKVTNEERDVERCMLLRLSFELHAVIHEEREKIDYMSLCFWSWPASVLSRYESSF